MKKRSHFKKYIAAAACICLLVPAGIFAGGTAVSYVSTTNIADYKTSTDWNDLDSMEKKVGIKTDAVESFSNGYRYTELNTDAFNALDEDGNKIFKVKELGVIYKNASGKELNCSIHAADERMADDVEHGGPDPDAPDAQPDGRDAHVLDRGVGEEAFVVVGAAQEKRAHAQRENAHDEQYLSLIHI